jgi:molybdate transport system substrate-binding protein
VKVTFPSWLIAQIVLSGAILAMSAQLRVAEIKVIGDSPLEPAMMKVIPLFEQRTNTHVVLSFDPSPAVKKRIESGERADVLLIQPDFVEELVQSGKVQRGDMPIFGRVGVGLGNRVDSPAHDISTPEKLKQTLLGADMLVFNNVMSGNAFAKILERMGIADALKQRIVRTSPMGIFDPVLKGKVDDMAAGTMTLIATTPGIKPLGPLPGDLQSFLSYTAVMMIDSEQRDAAGQFIHYLSSPEAKSALMANGVN